MEHPQNDDEPLYQSFAESIKNYLCDLDESLMRSTPNDVQVVDSSDEKEQ
jgi:hypothetical protein